MPRAKSKSVPPRPTPSDNGPGLLLARAAAKSLIEDKCTDVVVLDVRGRSQVTDYLVIGSGTSDRQMRSAAESVKKSARELGESIVRSNLDERTTWVVLDCINVVVHIFEPNTRAHYDLEMLWGDAPRVEFDLPVARRARRSPQLADSESPTS